MQKLFLLNLSAAAEALGHVCATPTACLSPIPAPGPITYCQTHAQRPEGRPDPNSDTYTHLSLTRPQDAHDDHVES